MLQSLTIHNYALINELHIDFNHGFSTLTGETGAGKSILLGALSLALGNRADSSALSNNSNKCIIEACFDVAAFNLQPIFATLDLDYEDNTIIRREITPNGKSRAFINDTPVTLNDLKTISSRLIDIHSQHENLLLNDNLFQLNVLDAAAKNLDTLEAYKQSYKLYKKLNAQLDELQNRANNAAADSEYNQFQFNQLSELKLESVNQQELEYELELLSNSQELQLNLSAAFQLLSEDETNAIAQLKEAKSAFDKIKGYFEQAHDFSQRIESCIIDLQDISSETETSAESLEYNPERDELVKELLDKVYSQFQKHKVESIIELIEIRNALDNSLLQEESFGQKIEETEIALKKQEAELSKLAKQLSTNRKNAITPLCASLSSLLSDLGMPNTVITIELTLAENYTQTGTDTISFLFSANKSMPPQNINKIASGGEISRLMLSIKYLLSASIALPTIIFDEIDTGVSGDIADKMANIMQQMAQNMQVISITHLPQIAAKGQTHYRVFKQEVNSHVETNIAKLENNERIQEIAKMLSGSSITQQAIENAKALILQ